MALQPKVMQRLSYHLLDVFTRQPFGGNQLAVFPDAADIAPAVMPRIARELNLSETVFLLPPERDGLARLRIFTPGAELPFAGHPTVGTACLLASLGIAARRAGQDGAMSIVLEEGVGDVHVRIRPGDARMPAWAELTAAQLPDVRAPELPLPIVATLLGVEPSDVGFDDAGGPGPAAASCGVPFLFVRLHSIDALRRCRLNMTVWETHVAHGWAPQVFPYFLADHADVRGRMFAPAMGITEDPATGSAAAALAGLLARHAGSDGTHRWILTQGVEMGRPSILELEAAVRSGSVTSCSVGGHAVVVGRGELLIP